MISKQRVTFACVLIHHMVIVEFLGKRDWYGYSLPIKKFSSQYQVLIVVLQPSDIYRKEKFTGETLIDNEASIRRLSEISVAFAQAGADIIAPSDMMDGRIAAIKDGLHKSGLGNKVSILYRQQMVVWCKPVSQLSFIIAF